MFTVVKKGVHYIVKSFTGNTEQEILFTHRDGKGVPVEGTTREAIYSMMINMEETANDKKWSAENELRISLLKRCLQSQRAAITNKINETKG